MTCDRKVSNFLKMVCLTAAGVLISVIMTAAQTGVRSNHERAVHLFLRDYFKNELSPDTNISYVVDFVDLNEDKMDEAIVHLAGQDMCGSGGCITLVLMPEGTTYKLVTEISITNRPIRVLESSSHGWHDLTSIVHGGGILRPYEAVLQFDGKTYPENRYRSTSPSSRRPAARSNFI